MTRKPVTTPRISDHRKIERRPDEFRIEMKVKTVLHAEAFLIPHIDFGGAHARAETRIHEFKHSAISGTRPIRISVRRVKIP